ncbi:RLA class II histocompatibility antigen, DP alpha-1 chain-like [Platichthys flesus]|uniref:RLA class II histocompatibility antigen, DP alpha-1 chain-like n=1 Tax=Platichthys flesus TaxID=8260 RepID=UPI002DB69A03|nr:RLA class II histocompatibility antigen, DP alpha-1 chain-like [Platichthys flesus]
MNRKSHRDVHILCPVSCYCLCPSTRSSTASPISLIFPKQHTEPGVPNTLICFVNDFHPPVVDISWNRNGQPVDESEFSQTQYYSNSDFSFRTSSYLDFTPEEGDIYSCSVAHVSLQAPLTRFWGGSVNNTSSTCVSRSMGGRLLFI